MLDLIIATNNNHKIEEFKQLFSSYKIKIHSPKELGIEFNPNETGSTFEKNSLIKAEAIQKYTNMPIMSDDSGLQINSLGGFPGIYSARFASECGGNDKANLEIIKKLKNYKNKSAQFICVITLLNVENKVLQFTGICNGRILDKPHGKNGFGYDPIFYSNDANIPFGEAKEELKNKYSHRALAISKLIKYLKDNKII